MMVDCRRIAFIGMEEQEILEFSKNSKKRADVKNMRERLYCMLFNRAYGKPAHFMIAMDFWWGIITVENILGFSELDELGYKLGNVSVELATVLGLGGQKGKKNEEKRYFELREKIPESRFASIEKRDRYLVDNCDEIIFVTSGKSARIRSLIAKANAMRRKTSFITPDLPAVDYGLSLQLVKENTIADELKRL